MAVTVQGALAAREEPGRALVSAIATPNHRLVHLSAEWPALQETECDRQPLRPCGIRSESAQSPHCIAQQRTTVRNKVEEKALRPAVLWQNPWSEVCRYLLCKQKAVGSSPTVSTTQKCWPGAGWPDVHRTVRLSGVRIESPSARFSGAR